MSLREKTKKKKYGVFLFPQERTVGSTTTTKIKAGKVQEGEVVKLQWDKDEVPAKILRLTGKITIYRYNVKFNYLTHISYQPVCLLIIITHRSIETQATECPLRGPSSLLKAR